MSKEPTELELRKLVEEHGLKVPPDVIAQAFGITVAKLEEITSLAKRKIKKAMIEDETLAVYFPIISNFTNDGFTQK